MAGRSGLTIREFSDADRESVLALARELQHHEIAIYDRMKPPDQIGPWYIEHLISEVTKHKGAFLVAETRGALVGYATLLAECSSENEVDEVLYTYAYVGDLVVSAEAPGQGIGKALLAECAGRAKAAGQDRLRVGVIGANARARKFYRDFGMDEQFLVLEKRL